MKHQSGLGAIESIIIILIIGLVIGAGWYVWQSNSTSTSQSSSENTRDVDANTGSVQKLTTTYKNGTLTIREWGIRGEWPHRLSAAEAYSYSQNSYEDDSRPWLTSKKQLETIAALGCAEFCNPSNSPWLDGSTYPFSSIVRTTQKVDINGEELPKTRVEEAVENGDYGYDGTYYFYQHTPDAGIFPNPLVDSKQEAAALAWQEYGNSMSTFIKTLQPAE